MYLMVERSFNVGGQSEHWMMQHVNKIDKTTTKIKDLSHQKHPQLPTQEIKTLIESIHELNVAFKSSSSGRREYVPTNHMTKSIVRALAAIQLLPFLQSPTNQAYISNLVAPLIKDLSKEIQALDKNIKKMNTFKEKIKRRRVEKAQEGSNDPDQSEKK